MAIDFPNSPTNGQTHTVGATTWTYDGSKWNKNATTIVGPTGPNPLVVQTGTPSTTNVLWLDTDAIPTNVGIPVSLVDAKGDLIVGSAADTVARLGVGSNGDLLVADSTATNGLRWQGQANTGRNMVINGAMQVAQRGTSKTGLTGNSEGYYAVDRWFCEYNTTGTFTQDIQDDAPSGSGLRKSTRFLFTSADSSIAAGELVLFRQRLEGQDLQRFAKGTASAQQFTFSFWVKSNVTGTYVLELQDTDNSRGVSASYTVSASGTWEKKTITFPADTTGVFDNDNNVSLAINFWLMAGSNFSSGTLATTWGSLTSANRAVGQTNLAAATNNYWQITGVQLEVGPVATGFDFEPYETTLRKCQRYYLRLGLSDTSLYGILMSGGYIVTSTQAKVIHPLSVTMRAPASSVEFSNIAVADSNGDPFSTTTLTLNGNQTNNVIICNAPITGATAHRPAVLCKNNNIAGYIGFSAELL